MLRKHRQWLGCSDASQNVTELYNHGRHCKHFYFQCRILRRIKILHSQWHKEMRSHLEGPLPSKDKYETKKLSIPLETVTLMTVKDSLQLLQHSI